MKYHILTRSPHSELHAAVVIEGQGLRDLRSRVPPMNVDSEGDVSIDLREATLTFMLIFGSDRSARRQNVYVLYHTQISKHASLPDVRGH